MSISKTIKKVLYKGRKNKGALDIGTLNFPKRNAGGRKWVLTSFVYKTIKPKKDSWSKMQPREVKRPAQAHTGQEQSRPPSDPWDTTSLRRYLEV